jgi:hypothetical protein
MPAGGSLAAGLAVRQGSTLQEDLFRGPAFAVPMIALLVLVCDAAPLHLMVPA